MGNLREWTGSLHVQDVGEYRWDEELLEDEIPLCSSPKPVDQISEQASSKLQTTARGRWGP